MADYKAIIEGRERDVRGWTRERTLLLADGDEIAMTTLEEEELTGKIWRIARLKLKEDGWAIDGENLETAWWSALGKPRDLREGATWMFKADTQLHLTLECLRGNLNNDFSQGREGLHRVIEVVSMRMAWRAKLTRVLGVAWSEDRMAAGGAELPSPYYLPILLTRLDFLVNKVQREEATNQEAESAAEYLVGIKAAADYVGRSERTIKNWIQKDWLKSERSTGRGEGAGKLIRFKKAELDKCLRRK